MKNPVYKQIELTGTSSESVEAAVKNAVKRAHKTLKNLCWFEVVETRGRLSEGKIEQWQVSIKVGFALEN
jgi:flavin-binding protein dodecin